jgi:hypothetical protein
MDQVISFLSTPLVTSIVSIVKAIFIVISIILFIAIIILMKKTTWLRFRYLEDYTEFLSTRPFGTKAKFKRLEGINKKLESEKEEDYKFAVIEIEDYLKEVLQKMGYKGELLDEILDQVDAKVLPSIGKVKEVQKIRDSIVGDPNFELTADQAKNIVKIYEKALGELEAL